MTLIAIIAYVVFGTVFAGWLARNAGTEYETDTNSQPMYVLAAIFWPLVVTVGTLYYLFEYVRIGAVPWFLQRRIGVRRLVQLTGPIEDQEPAHTPGGP